MYEPLWLDLAQHALERLRIAANHLYALLVGRHELLGPHDLRAGWTSSADKTRAMMHDHIQIAAEGMQCAR